MSDETQVLDQPNAGIAVPGEVQPQSQSTPVGGDDVESRARSQGWVSRDEFRGDPDKWRPADEFVKRGEELLPVALERSRAAERKAQDLETRLAAKEREFDDKIGRLERISTAAVQRERDRLDAMYRNAQRSAVETGDTARFDQLDRDRQTAVENYDKHIQEQVQPRQQPGQPQGLPPDRQVVVDGWMQKNEWFNRDPELNAVAQAFHVRLGNEKPGLSLAENLAETEKYVRQRYADKFGGTPQRQITTPMVEAGGGRMPATAGTRAKGASDLPGDVRRVGESFVKQGLFKDLNEYARDYFAQD